MPRWQANSQYGKVMTPDEFQKLSLVELERLTGVHNTTWCRYKKGRRMPSLRQLKKLSHLLGMEPSVLLGVLLSGEGS